MNARVSGKKEKQTKKYMTNIIFLITNSTIYSPLLSISLLSYSRS